MSKTYQEWLDTIQAQNNEKAKQEISEYNRMVDADTSNVASLYNSEIDQTQRDYTTQYDLNEIQRLINEKEVAENMANLGLTNSGLNRTQQTATQLSYGNIKATINSDMQKAITSLKSQLAEHVAEAQKKKSEYAISTNKAYNDDAVKQAEKLYNDELEAATQRQKNQLSANAAAASKYAADRKTAVSTLKNDFSSMKKQYEGFYSKEIIKSMFTELSNAEKSYSLSSFEDIVILSQAGLEYDDYCEWKSTGMLPKNSNNTSPIGNIIAPYWLR